MVEYRNVAHQGYMSCVLRTKLPPVCTLHKKRKSPKGVKYMKFPVTPKPLGAGPHV